MLNTDYRIEKMKDLLNEDCILERYYPLIPYKNTLVDNLSKMGCLRKTDCMDLSVEVLLEAGLPDGDMVNLFRAFLRVYDIKPAKMKEIATVCTTPEEAKAFRELYHLPGVKSTRATLYYKAGYGTLKDIASSTPEEIISRTDSIIKKENLSLKTPLMKEVRTHIAVAKAFSDNAAM